MKIKHIYLAQYNDGKLSAVIHDDRATFDEFLSLIALNKRKYPVAVWIVKPKENA